MKLWGLLIVTMFQGILCPRPLGVDTTAAVPEETARCLLALPDTKLLMFRGFMPPGLIDRNGIESLKTAIRLTNASTVYMVPNPKGDGQSQGTMLCQELKNQIPDHMFRVIVDVEHPEQWSRDKLANRRFAKALFDSLQWKLGCFGAGVLTRKEQFEAIFGADYHDLVANSIWYIHEDNDPSPRDFRPFGGWTKPVFKQYAANKQFCGITVNQDSDVYHGLPLSIPIPQPAS